MLALLSLITTEETHPKAFLNLCVLELQLQSKDHEHNPDVLPGLDDKAAKDAERDSLLHCSNNLSISKNKPEDTPMPDNIPTEE